MDFVLVAAVALCVSGLTMYSGFGLVTLLMPVFALVGLMVLFAPGALAQDRLADGVHGIDHAPEACAHQVAEHRTPQALGVGGHADQRVW